VSGNSDINPPGKVTCIDSCSGECEVVLCWNDPLDGDLASIEITWTPPHGPGNGSASVSKGTQSYTASGLTDNTPYTFTIRAKDTLGLYSGTTDITLTPSGSGNSDLTPPGKVTGLAAVPDDGEVALSWTDPTDTDLDSIEITWSPGNGSATVPGGTQTYTATGLTNGITYTFTVRALDNATPTANKSQRETTTGKPRAPTAGVKVNFTGLPQNETINLIGDEDLDWSDNDSLTVSVVGGSFIGYRWVLDGDPASLPGETNYFLTLSAQDLSVKQHQLTVFVTTSGGVEYAKSVYFTVRF
jgi:hypothetical protein